jgi:hypothetical protein
MYLSFWHKSGFWRNFDITFAETFYTKNAIREHKFTLVTHMTYSDTQFGSYGFLKTEQGAELFWTDCILE